MGDGGVTRAKGEQSEDGGCGCERHRSMLLPALLLVALLVSAVVLATINYFHSSYNVLAARHPGLPPFAAAFGTACAQTWVTVCAAGGMAVIITLFFIVSRIRSPLLSLASQVRRAATSVGSPICISGKGECAEIADAFNRYMARMLEMERQVAKMEKLEVVGVLGAGLCHEFNTVLTSISGFADYLRRKIPEDDPLRQYAGHILAASERGAYFTRSILSFARWDPAGAEVVNLNEVIDETLQLFSRMIADNVSVMGSVSDEPLRVEGDRHYLCQAILNLVKNAGEAMPAGGTVMVEAKKREVDAELAARLHKPVSHVAEIAVADSGTGMASETLEHIFEPFFTTKEIGKGTGIGLTLVSGIVREHGGYVTAESVPGAGSRFLVYLPLCASSS